MYDVRLWSYGASNLPNFRIFACFLYTKPPKHTFRWPAYSPGVTSQNDFFMWQSKIQRGAFRQRRFRATSGKGAGYPQTFPKFRLWQMTIPIQNATARCVRSGPKMSENTQFWGQMYFFTKYLCPYSQNHPKTPFWGTFQCKPIIHRALRKSHINGATKLTLYSYRGIDRYLVGVSKFFR